MCNYRSLFQLKNKKVLKFTSKCLFGAKSFNHHPFKIKKHLIVSCIYFIFVYCNVDHQVTFLTTLYEHYTLHYITHYK